MLSYLWGENTKQISKEFTVAVAESVTAGAVANTLCSESGSSKFFKGGIVAYSIQSKKDILGIDIEYAEQNNFTNDYTTLQMAKKIAEMFNARIGISTTGYSHPTRREKTETQCELNIEHPYAKICIYDRYTDMHKIYRFDFEYDPNKSENMQRANVQVKVALEARKLYQDYIDDNLTN